MTAQIPEQLINKHGEIDFYGNTLYSICVGDPTSLLERQVYPFKHKGDLDKCQVFSACWRGYVSVYELKQSGEIYLVKFEYPFGSESSESDEVNERLEGDFWLDLRTEFFGSRLFVPFENGQIVIDKDKWIIKA